MKELVTENQKHIMQWKFKTQSSLAHIHLILTFILITSGMVASIITTKPMASEFWMLCTSFATVGMPMFEYFFGNSKKKDENGSANRTP